MIEVVDPCDNRFSIKLPLSIREYLTYFHSSILFRDDKPPSRWLSVLVLFLPDKATSSPFDLRDNFVDSGFSRIIFETLRNIQEVHEVAVVMAMDRGIGEAYSWIHADLILTLCGLRVPTTRLLCDILQRCIHGLD